MKHQPAKIAGWRLLVFILFLVGFPGLALGEKDDFLVVDIKNEIPFDEESISGSGPDYYINGGEDVGFQEGMTLDVYRPKSIEDSFNGEEYEIRILVGQIEVIRVFPNTSVTRIQSLESAIKNPILDYHTIMVGDRVISRTHPSMSPAHLSLPASILFDFNSWELKSVGRHALSTVYDLLNNSKDMEILIEGHTCNIGTDAYNRKLSLKRAQSAANFLAQSKGLPKERIQVAGFGEERPFTSNKTDAGRRKNRRVDFRLLSKKTGDTKKS